MTTKFIGISASQFAVSDASIVDTNSGYMKSLMTTSDAFIIGPINYHATVKKTLDTAVDSMWLHFNMGVKAESGGINSQRLLFSLTNDSGVVIAQIYKDSSGTTQFMVLERGALTNVGSFTFNEATLYVFDLHFSNNAVSGVCELFVGGKSVGSVTGNLSALGKAASFTWSGVDSSYGATQMGISQVIVADYKTVGCSVITSLPSAAGTHSDWKGDYTDVSEVSPDTSTVITSDTAVQTSTFKGPTLAIDSSLVVKSVAVSAIAMKGETGPTSIKGAVVSNGKLGVGNKIALTDGFAAATSIMDTDPTTGAAWTNANAEACEFGVQSET